MTFHVQKELTLLEFLPAWKHSTTANSLVSDINPVRCIRVEILRGGAGFGWREGAAVPQGGPVVRTGGPRPNSKRISQSRF